MFPLEHVVQFALNLNPNVYRNSQIERDIDLHWKGDETLFKHIFHAIKKWQKNYSLANTWRTPTSIQMHLNVFKWHTESNN